MVIEYHAYNRKVKPHGDGGGYGKLLDRTPQTRQFINSLNMLVRTNKCWDVVITKGENMSQFSMLFIANMQGIIRIAPLSIGEVTSNVFL